VEIDQAGDTFAQRLKVESYQIEEKGLIDAQLIHGLPRLSQGS
jgi:hypothetical protein